ncbi:HERC6 [Symbiodinium natans]|uniref:HERC6 protein n=1 Tax=Symbiodinium natans TaxID=878477 RepID=A0A812JAG2_9DINO|nr:HERC6 [Symbiodinium natans]
MIVLLPRLIGHSRTQCAQVRAKASRAGPVNILMLGATGHGKSSLGNFLLHPDLRYIFEEDGCRQPFRVGDDRLSCTASCSIKDSPDGQVRIMDTPGLNESHERDLHHMINVVKTARQLHHVHAVILAMKMDSRMDQTYKDTIQYYYKLLGDEVFKTNSNLILVLTDYRPKDRKYKKDPELLGRIVSQSADDVQKELELPVAPFTVPINSVPQDEDELKQSRGPRDQILDLAVRNMAPAVLQTLQVPKTEGVQRRHGKEAARLQGIIAEKEETKKQLLKLPDPVKMQARLLEDEMKTFDTERKNLRAGIEALDKEELCKVAEVHGGNSPHRHHGGRVLSG